MDTLVSMDTEAFDRVREWDRQVEVCWWKSVASVNRP